MQIEKKLLDLYKDPSLTEKPKELEERGGACYSRAAFSIISSMLNNKGEKHVVNIPNNGIYIDLPSDAIIETPVKLYSSGMNYFRRTYITSALRGLIESVKSLKALQWSIVKASYKYALMALMAHPLTVSMRKHDLSLILYWKEYISFSEQ
jgi:6-phospho-beta-glucosidase